MITSDAKGTIKKRTALAAFAVVIVLCLYVTFGASPEGSGAAVSSSGKWTCSMCPQFILPAPGKCPKCFMDLIPLEEGAGGGSRLELHLSPAAAELASITAEIAEPLEDDAEEPLLVIPVSAALTSQGRSFVFVESLEEEHLVYTLREIETRGMVDGRLVVAAGLNDGEAVAATGVFRIDSAMQILGKTSLTSIPTGELSADDGLDLPPYQPAERSALDLRAEMPGIDAWFAGYEQVRAALARDENAESESRARAFDALLTKAGIFPEREPADLVSRLAASSHELAAAKDLPSRRAAFEGVTANLVTFARRYGSPDEGLNLIFCPMAFSGSGAYWLQPETVVDNPYHGLEMPLCGWMIESIAPFE